jgi:hypothetical protein
MSPQRFLRILLLAVLAAQLCACAASNQALRSQPAGIFNVADYPVTTGPLSGMVTLRCAKISGTKYQAPRPVPAQVGDSALEKAQELECDSVSADVTELTSLSQEDQADVSSDVLHLLLAISDYNCSNFLNRAFSVRSTLDFTSKLVADLATGASAGTASVAPGVSAGLSGLNLVLGKTDAEFAATYYADKTFSALEKAITAERTKTKTQILGNKSDDYYVTDAISDSRKYDDACSIKSGLSSLNDAADQAKKTQDGNLTCVKSAMAAKDATKKMKSMMNVNMGMAPNCQNDPTPPPAAPPAAPPAGGGTGNH